MVGSRLIARAKDIFSKAKSHERRNSTGDNLQINDGDIRALSRQPSESSKRRVSFKLLRRVSHTLSKSHPTIRENIILHGLSLLKKQFPLALNDLNARSIYCNLLELCRSHGESQSSRQVRQEALRLLLIQINSGIFATLVDAFYQDVPDTMLSEILSQLFACVPHKWMESTRDLIHQSIHDTFQTATDHPLLPFMQFIQLLSNASPACAHAIVDVRYADAVLCLCLTDFSFPKSTNDILPSPSIPLLDTCKATLSTLALHAGNHALLSSRWSLLREYWPPVHRFEFEDSFFNGVMYQYHENQHQVEHAEAPILDRTFALRRLDFLGQKTADVFLVSQGCGELIHLSRGSSGDPAIRSYVVTILAEVIGSEVFRNYQHGWNELRSLLIRNKYGDVVNFLTIFMDYLQNELSSSSSNLGNIGRIINVFLDFAEFVTNDSYALLAAFVHSGLPVLRPFRDEGYWRRYEFVRRLPEASWADEIEALDEEDREDMILYMSTLGSG